MVKNRLVDIEIDNGFHARCNTIFANVMVLPECMEERGNCLSCICNEIKALEGYKDNLKPSFNSTPTKKSPSITAIQMSESPHTIERDISLLKQMIILIREGKDNEGKLFFRKL